MKSTSLLTLTLTILCCTSSALSQTALPVPPAAKMKIKDLSRDLGASLAMNETYILAGSPSSSNGSFTNAGDVQVYRVSDGSFVRRLVSPYPAFNGYFGKGLAIYGNIAYIGAEGDAPSPSIPSSGAVYAFDIVTGKNLWLALGAQGQNIGYSLSISGDLMAVGAPNGELSGQAVASGSVAVMDRKDGYLIQSYRLPSAAFADRFGYSVALRGRLLAAGAPYRDQGGLVDSGVVAVFDAIAGGAMTMVAGDEPKAGAQFGYAVSRTKNFLAIGAPEWTTAGRAEVWSADGTVYNRRLYPVGDADNVGRSLASAGNMVLVGGYFTANRGKVDLFDLANPLSPSVEVATHTDADAVNLGVALAMTEQALVIGDNLQPIPNSANKGSLWLARMPQQRLAARFRYGVTGDLAPGLTSVRYSTFAEPTLMESSGRITFRASLKGTGVTAGNNSAVFSNNFTDAPELIVRKGDKASGQTVSALNSMFFGASMTSPMIVRTTTGGLTTIFRDDGTSLLPEIRANTVPSDPNLTATISSITALTGGGNTNAMASVVYTAKLGAGVTLANDSRVSTQIRYGARKDYGREGDAYDATAKLGQISPRLAGATDWLLFHSALTGASTTNNTAITKSNGTSKVEIARKGDSAPSAMGTYTAFLGEGISLMGNPIFRATTSTGLEGLWYSASNELIAFKGQSAPGTPSGVKFKSFIQFFISNADDILFTATLTGTGVNSTNDKGVWLSKSGNISLLLREGDAAPDCDSARIGTISEVDFGTLHGFYSILATLTGTSSSTNQALFYGDSNPTDARARMPMLNVRKGSYIDRPGGKRITSLSIGTHNVDAGGSGSKGSVRLVSNLGALVRITYSDAQQELIVVRP